MAGLSVSLFLSFSLTCLTLLTLGLTPSIARPSAHTPPTLASSLVSAETFPASPSYATGISPSDLSSQRRAYLSPPRPCSAQPLKVYWRSFGQLWALFRAIYQTLRALPEACIVPF